MASFRKLYDKEKIDFSNLLYPNRAMFLLLVPIVVEQLLNSFMGMADTMMVSNVGSEAISAVSLVDSINNLVIQMFAAMASGAAILCSQYLGHLMLVAGHIHHGGSCGAFHHTQKWRTC